tara:strand:- start:2124 stop:2534 length:411 start_codon:yes stop_codon:yes gene_type:complete
MGNNTSCGEGTRLNGNSCVPMEIVTCGKGTIRENRPDGVFCVSPETTADIPALTCGPGTAIVNNECIIQFGAPLQVGEQHVCGIGGSNWSGMTIDMSSNNEIPSSIEVRIGGYACDDATRRQNLCERFPQNPICNS